MATAFDGENKIKTANQAQVKQALDRAGVLANLAAYGNADTAPLGYKFALTCNDKSLRHLLNEIVKTSDQYWVPNRDGSRGEFLILNF